jgi:predicted transcriptional regulator
MNAERSLYGDPDARERARLRALADIEAGRTVSHAEVAEWLKSWGTADEKPMPAEWLK